MSTNDDIRKIPWNDVLAEPEAGHDTKKKTRTLAPTGLCMKR